MNQGEEKSTTYKVISGQKRQALITKFFSKIEKKKLGANGEIDLALFIWSWNAEEK